MGTTVKMKKLRRFILSKESSVGRTSIYEITIILLSSCRVMAQKQSNAEYAQVPNEENTPATAVLPSNAINEQPSADEAAASETPENDEKHEVQKEETAGSSF